MYEERNVEIRNKMFYALFLVRKIKYSEKYIKKKLNPESSRHREFKVIIIHILHSFIWWILIL